MFFQKLRYIKSHLLGVGQGVSGQVVVGVVKVVTVVDQGVVDVNEVRLTHDGPSAVIRKVPVMLIE